MKHSTALGLFVALAMAASAASAQDAAPQVRPPAPASDLEAHDHPWSESGWSRFFHAAGLAGDDGEKIDLCWTLSPDDVEAEDAQAGAPAAAKHVLRYEILRAAEPDGLFEPVGAVEPDPGAYRTRRLKVTVEKCERGEEYYFRVAAVGPAGITSEYAEAGPVRAVRQLLDRGRFWIGVITALLCGAVVYWIRHARKGKPLKIRKIAGLEAVDEAVGRATEMGRSCLFVPGIQDMNDMQTIAGLTVLSRVATTAAEYDARLEVPTSKSLVMTAARETVEAAFFAAGRPEAYNEDLIYYVTDEQFGYVAYLSGLMVRDKPAACFYMGAFFAESLILAETGNSIGAIQMAGTAMPAQLPFFVAACDYTLIGEEFFAASAYLSGEPEQLGSLKGQDMGKLFAAALLVAGCLLATLATLPGLSALQAAVDFLTETVLT
jgi:hypothetical protein